MSRKATPQTDSSWMMMFLGVYTVEYRWLYEIRMYLVDKGIVKLDTIYGNCCNSISFV